MKQNQNGFSTVVILLFVLVLAVIGFGGWYVWQLNQADNTSENTTSTNANNAIKKTSDSISEATKASTPASTAVTKSEYLSISGQNVRLPLTSDLSGLKAGSVEASTYSTADKSVPVLAPELDANWECVADADGSKGSIGKISITSQDKRSGPGEPTATKKIGAYTYGFEPGGSNCTSSPRYNELVAAFEKQFGTLESY